MDAIHYVINTQTGNASSYNSCSLVILLIDYTPTYFPHACCLHVGIMSSEINSGIGSIYQYSGLATNINVFKMLFVNIY